MSPIPSDINAATLLTLNTVYFPAALDVLTSPNKFIHKAFTETRKIARLELRVEDALHDIALASFTGLILSLFMSTGVCGLSLKGYYEASKWSPGLPCAFCARALLSKHSCLHLPISFLITNTHPSDKIFPFLQSVLLFSTIFLDMDFCPFNFLTLHRNMSLYD